MTSSNIGDITHAVTVIRQEDLEGPTPDAQVRRATIPHPTISRLTYHLLLSLSLWPHLITPQEAHSPEHGYVLVKSSEGSGCVSPPPRPHDINAGVKNQCVRSSCNDPRLTNSESVLTAASSAACQCVGVLQPAGKVVRSLQRVQR